MVSPASERLYDTAMRQGLSLVGVGADKRPLLKRWQLTPPLREHDDPQASFAELETWPSIGIVLRTSGLVGIETDSADDTETARHLVRTHGLKPVRVEVRHDGTTKRHLYFREPYVLDVADDVAYRVERGDVIGTVTQQFRTEASETSDYMVSFEDWQAPKLTREQYAALVAWEREHEARQREALSSGRALPEGGRAVTLFRFACLVCNWTVDEALVLELVDLWNEATCRPPLPFSEVTRQVRGARRKTGAAAVELSRYQRRDGGIGKRRLGAAIGRFDRQVSRWAPSPELRGALAARWAARLT